jgi:hypothetical protein
MKNVEKKKIPLAQETLGFFLQIRSDVATAVSFAVIIKFPPQEGDRSSLWVVYNDAKLPKMVVVVVYKAGMSKLEPERLAGPFFCWWW